MSKDTKLEVRNTGPIKGTFSVDMSAGPGLYELRGGKGTGKSTVLNAVELITGHKVSLTVHDGELDGSVQGFGVVAPIGSKKRSRGSLEVHAIDAERFDLVDVIDPQGKTPATRDAVRIKALGSLSGLTLRPKDFFGIAGGEDEYSAMAINTSDDAVTMCSRVKAAIEQRARIFESMAEDRASKAAALDESSAPVDPKCETDEVKLSEAVEAAAVNLADLRSRRVEVEAAQEQRSAAGAALANAESEYDGPTVTEATSQAEKAEKAFMVAEEVLAKAERVFDDARLELRAAVRHESLTAAWRETLETPLPEAVAEEEIDAAKSDLEQSRQNQARGAEQRAARDAQARIDDHRKAAEEAIKRAEDLRGRSSAVWDLLAKRLKLKRLKITPVEGVPRLVVEHGKRGKKTLYDAVNGLSDGERVREAINEFLPRMQSPALFPLSQRLWQDLPPTDRQEIAEYAAEQGIYIIAAQVTDDQLHVKRWGAE